MKKSFYDAQTAHAKKIGDEYSKRYIEGLTRAFKSGIPLLPKKEELTDKSDGARGYRTGLASLPHRDFTFRGGSKPSHYSSKRTVAVRVTAETKEKWQRAAGDKKFTDWIKETLDAASE